jgi:nucleotide-binding universal stress UspA family protein
LAITKILVVVDKSLASMRAVTYVAQILGGRRGFRICLAHTLPSPPAGMMEFGGTEDPGKEDWLEARLRAGRHLWASAAKRKASVPLDHAYAELRRSGFTRGEIEVQFCFPSDKRNAPKEILAMARDLGCHTIVVGRRSLSWLREFLQTNPADELVRLGKGFTTWVVK